MLTAAGLLGAVLTAVPATSALASGVSEISLLSPTSVPDSAPIGLTTGPSGSVWFAENSGGLGKVDSSGVVTQYGVGVNSRNLLGVPEAMTTASDGSLWFSDLSQVVPRIGKVNSSTGASTFYELPAVSADGNGGVITDLVQGPDGAIWFTGHAANLIGRLDPATGTATTFPVPAGSSTYGITKGPDNALWFTDDVSGIVGRIDTSGNETTYAPPSSGATATPVLGSITTGPDHAVWFTEPAAGKIGRIDPGTGNITEYPVGTVNSQPQGITAGPDGSLWFTEAAASNIGKITPSGTVTEYPLVTTLSAPNRIISGPGGQLWFTESGKGAIGHVDPASPPSGTPNSAPPTPSPLAVSPFQGQCPLNVGICETQVNTGGTTKIGKFSLAMPPNAIRITGLITGLTPGSTLSPPLSGQELVSNPVTVPGGVIGTLPLIGPILGLTPAAMVPFNTLTVSETLAGPIGIAITPENTTQATVPLTIHLNNTLLGPDCTIGPVTAVLTPTALAGDPHVSDVSLGWQTGQYDVKDSTLAAPGAKGCGTLGILNGVINSTLGLPAASGKNLFDLPLVLGIGFGVNTTAAHANVAPTKAAVKRPAGHTTTKVTGVTSKVTARS